MPAKINAMNYLLLKLDYYHFQLENGMKEFLYSSCPQVERMPVEKKLGFILELNSYRHMALNFLGMYNLDPEFFAAVLSTFVTYIVIIIQLN